MLRPVQTTPPAELPVSLGDMKEHLRVDHDDDDALIESHIASAVDHLNGYAGLLGRCIVTQSWRQDFKEWDWRFRLPFPDVASATITYRDADNAEQAVSADEYEIIRDARGDMVVFKDTFQEPSTFDDVFAPISVTFTAGYGAPAAVPQDIKIAILLLAQLDYDQPDPQKAAGIERAIDAKVYKHRWVRV